MWAFLAAATLTLTPPTTNTDGSPLTDLVSYDIYYGCEQSGVYTDFERFSAGGTTFIIENLPEPGTCYFAATAVNSDNISSAFSNEATKSFSSSTQLPGPVTDLQVSWQEHNSMALDDTGLLVRYYADEAASGSTPTDLLDTSGVGTALDLPITYGDSLAYTEVSGNRGLHSDSDAGTGIAKSGTLSSGNKIFDALDGSKTATLEYVIDITTYNTNGARIFGLMNGDTGDGTFLMTGDSSGNDFAEIRINNGADTGDVGTITGRSVIHIVWDSAQLDVDDRILLYIDAVLQTGLSVNTTIDTTLSFSTTSLVVLNRGSQNRSALGTFFYGAIYSGVLSASTISDHYDILTLDDDTPAAGGLPIATVMHHRRMMQ